MIMDYKEKYEMALEGIQEILGSGEDSIKMSRLQLRLQGIFPELKESEDERIKRELCKAIWTYIPNEEAHEYIAWLEKQGKKEQDVRYKHLEELLVADDIYQMAMNDTTIEEARTKAIEAISKIGISQLLGIEKQGEQKPADKIEPKFHEGEWITNGDYTWKIVEVKPLDYMLQSQDGNIVDDTISHVDEQFHSFTIQDARDGDVLATSAGAFIYNGNNGGGSCPGSYCGINTLGNFNVGVEHHWTGKTVFPATQEQRDTLMKAMTDAGYTFDFEKKELKKIENEIEIPFGAKDSELQEATYYITKGFHAEIDNDKVVIKKGKKPTTWSEDDENHLNSLIELLPNLTIRHNWLKSLKDRLQPKREWSEEDKKMLESIIYDFGKGRQSTTSQDNWLKSLAPWSIPKIRFV